LLSGFSESEVKGQGHIEVTCPSTSGRHDQTECYVMAEAGVEAQLVIINLLLLFIITLVDSSAAVVIRIVRT